MVFCDWMAAQRSRGLKASQFSIYVQITVVFWVVRSQFED